MTKPEQQRKAESFLHMHSAPPILVLPNAWDVSSARIFQLEGFKAVGTTSAGIAASLGYPDGERMGLEDNVDVVRRITGCIDLPISADMEAGYATSAEGVASASAAFLHAGAVGVNLEDSTGDPAKPLYDVSHQVERIAAVREVASNESVHLVVNARTDVYLVEDGRPSERLRRTVDRANAYLQAGADCVFVPDFGNLDRAAIACLVDEIDGPLNVIAGDRTPPVYDLEEIGVARVSVGPKPMRAALALLRAIAREMRDSGTYSRMLTDTLSYFDVNRMFERDDRGYCASPPITPELP